MRLQPTPAEWPGFVFCLPMVVLGIDGGGSATRAVLADEHGNVLGRGAAGPCNPLAVGVEQSRASIDAAVSAAWMTAHQDRRPADAAALGIAGLISTGLCSQMESVAADLALSSNPGRVTHDLHIALAGGLGGRAGVVLVSGTGSAAYACPDGGDGVVCGSLLS